MDGWSLQVYDLSKWVYKGPERAVTNKPRNFPPDKIKDMIIRLKSKDPMFPVHTHWKELESGLDHHDSRRKRVKRERE